MERETRALGAVKSEGPCGRAEQRRDWPTSRAAAGRERQAAPGAADAQPAGLPGSRRLDWPRHRRRFSATRAQQAEKVLMTQKQRAAKAQQVDSGQKTPTPRSRLALRHQEGALQTPVRTPSPAAEAGPCLVRQGPPFNPQDRWVCSMQQAGVIALPPHRPKTEGHPQRPRRCQGPVLIPVQLLLPRCSSIAFVSHDLSR